MGAGLCPYQLHPLPLDIHTFDPPPRIGPCPCGDVVALRLFIPPSPVFVRRRRKFALQYSFDLLKTERNFPLVFRQVAQVIFKRSVFSGHNYFFLYNSSPAATPTVHGRYQYTPKSAAVNRSTLSSLIYSLLVF